MPRLLAIGSLVAWAAATSAAPASSAVQDGVAGDASTRVAQDVVPGADSSGAELVLGFFAPGYLRRLDPITFETTSPDVPLAEYHSVAVSPDRSRLALALGSPGGGVTIVSLPELVELHRVHAGIAPVALAWLSPTQVAAALQCRPGNQAGRGCGIVLVDADEGRIVRRWPDTEADTEFLPFVPPIGSLPKPVAVTPRGVVFVLAHWSSLAPARLVLITAEEELRSTSLSEIPIGVVRRGPLSIHTSGGLAVDASGRRAFVVGVEGKVAVVDLETLRVEHPEIEAFGARPQVGETDPDSRVQRRFLHHAVVPLDNGRLAVVGESFLAGALDAREHAGVTVIDTETWTARTIDPQAGRATFAAGTLLAYGGESAGVAGYSSDGRLRFRLFGEKPQQRSVVAVHAHGTEAYVVSQSDADTSTVTLIDAATGTVVREATVPGRLWDLIAVPGR